MVSNYTFHNRISFQLETDDPAAQAFFQAEYELHRGEPAPATVRLCFHRRTPFSSIPSDYTRTHHKYLARWAYKIHITPQRIEIHAIGNRLSIPIIFHRMVLPALRMLPLEQGIAILHAAAVTYRGSSVLLTGNSGAGKTTLALLLAHTLPGVAIQADDHVFVDGSARSLPYHARMHLYDYLLPYLPFAGTALTPIEQLRLRFWGMVHRFSRRNIKWPVRVPAQRLWNELPRTESTPIHALVLLQRSNQSSLLLHPADPALAAQTVQDINAREFNPFLVLCAQSLSPAEREGWLLREHALLQILTQQLPVYTLRLPTHRVDPQEIVALLSPLFN